MRRRGLTTLLCRHAPGLRGPPRPLPGRPSHGTEQRSVHEVTEERGGHGCQAPLVHAGESGAEERPDADLRHEPERDSPDRPSQPGTPGKEGIHEKCVDKREDEASIDQVDEERRPPAPRSSGHGGKLHGLQSEHDDRHGCGAQEPTENGLPRVRSHVMVLRVHDVEIEESGPISARVRMTGVSLGQSLRAAAGMLALRASTGPVTPSKPSVTSRPPTFSRHTAGGASWRTTSTHHLSLTSAYLMAQSPMASPPHCCQ